MLDNIRKLALAAGVSAMALGSAVMAAEPVKISAIDVQTTVSTDDSNVIEFYPDLADDLRAEVAERVALSSDGADPQIKIDIRKVALNGATMLGDDRLFNQIEGVVDITSPTGETSAFSFPVKVAAQSGDEILPEGYVAVPPSETEFYVAMVSTFADVVAEGLEQVNTSGNKVDP